MRPHIPLTKLAVAVAAVSAGLILPSTASAATSCTFAGGVVDIDVTNGSVQVVVDRNGSNIEINDPFVTGNVACAGGTPTVTTTDSIVFDETATTGQGTSFAIDLTGGAFAPGVTNEAGASDEIEFTTSADADGTDRIFVTGGADDDNVRMGAVAANTGVNLNGAEADGLDVDVTSSGLDGAGSDTFGGDDTITADASGGAGLGFTGPLSFDVSLNGGSDDDVVVVGSGGNNRADGDSGNDTLTGGANGDSLNPGVGDDTVDGGGGTEDLVSYLNHTQAVTVDLRTTAQQNTGGAGLDTISNVEGTIGSNQSDTLTGSDSAAVGDRLIGGQLGADTGNDVLIGKGGPDLLRGAPGNDTLIGGAGNDSLDGSEGTDTASYAQDSTGPITFTLAQGQTGVAQSTGGAGNDTLFDHDTLFGAGDGQHEVENLTGSQFGDSLTGNDTANRIVGGNGGDTISLLDGVDEFDAYDGAQDSVNCGNAADTGTSDEQGVDQLSGCEATDFAPQVSIGGGPANGATTGDSTPTYSLSADEPSSFQVRVDGGGFQPCSASCDVPQLSDGAHTLDFRARDDDEAQNVGLGGATRTLTVDTAAPEVTVGGPSGTTTDETPTFTFTASEPAAFECRVDGEGFGPCSGPEGSHTTGALADGPHSFEVRATDSAGNQGTGAAAFTVDTVAGNPADTDPPETSVKKPKVKGDGVTLKFGSDEPGSSFRCKLDKKKFKPCTSPKRYRNLDDGKHKVLVAATDAAGNLDPTAAKAKFEIG
ncbi:MAG TPA: Ig-like domain-containing protein [Solirubrobacterales bacterium]